MITEMILKKIKENNRKHKKSPGNVAYVSMINSCMRKNYYRHNYPDEETEHDDRTLLIFEVGNIFHDYIYKVLQENDVLICSEESLRIKVKNGSIHGRLDVIVKYQEELYVLDVKTCSYHSKKMPHEKDIAQVQMYMYEKKIPRGFLMYVEKNNLKIKMFKFELDMNIVNGQLARVEELFTHIDENTLPVPEYMLAGKRDCDKCPFLSKCIANQK